MKPSCLERNRLALGVILLSSLSALADDAAILSSPTDVRDLLRDAQAARLPSPNVVTQDLGAAVVEPADASASAWFSAVGEGAAFAFEYPRHGRNRRHEPRHRRRRAPRPRAGLRSELGVPRGGLQRRDERRSPPVLRSVACRSLDLARLDECFCGKRRRPRIGRRC